MPSKKYDWIAEWTPLEIRGRLAALIIEERRIRGTVSEEAFTVRFGRDAPRKYGSWYTANVRPDSGRSKIHATVVPGNLIYLTMAALTVFFAAGLTTVAYPVVQRVAGNPLHDELATVGSGLGVSVGAALAYWVCRAAFWLDAEEMHEYLRNKLHRPVRAEVGSG